MLTISIEKCLTLTDLASHLTEAGVITKDSEGHTIYRKITEPTTINLRGAGRISLESTAAIAILIRYLAFREVDVSIHWPRTKPKVEQQRRYYLDRL